MPSVRRQCLAVAAMPFLVLAETPSQADIVATGGAVVVATPPANIGNGQWTSNTEIRAWFERQATLSTDLILDHVNTGVVNSPSQLVPGTITPGTPIWSYMVRLDPATGGTHTLSGFIVFDTPILGVLQDRPTLGATDTDLGRVGVTYNTNNNRGMELGAGGGQEFFQISNDRLRLDFLMIVTDGPTDDIRIVTAIPAPGASAVLLIGAHVVGRRRRRLQIP